MTALPPSACMLGLVTLIIGLLLAAATSAQRDGWRQDDSDGGFRG